MIDGRKIVALCLSRINDAVSHELITKLNKLLTESGCNLFVYATGSDLYWNTPSELGETKIFDLIDYNTADAIIVFSEKIKSRDVIENVISNAKRKNIPVISIGEHIEGCYYTGFDYEAGFEKTVRHVIEHHRPKTVHFMAGLRNNDFSDKRLAVFRKVIEENGYKFDESVVSYGEFWTGPTEAATEKLVAENRVPDAVICANDIMALTVCNVLKKHGISIPEDVIVTGFDGIEQINFSTPRVTSCECSYTDMAEKCADILKNVFSGNEAENNNDIIPRVILSESCGCGIAEKVSVSEYVNRVNDNFHRYQDESRTLSEITAKVQTSTRLEDASKELDSNVIYDMCCVLNYECIDESINPLTTVSSESFTEKMYLFFNTDEKEPFVPQEFSRSDIAPNLDDLLRQKCALIFMALNFLNIPLGYVCFHFHSDDIVNFYKIPQTVNALNNAVGGLRNLRYQQYLNAQISDMYKTDALTGLYNRSGFEKEYKKMLKTLKAADGITVVLADLDGLKKINDSFGHDEGDNAIATVARALKAACPENAICMRFGGDEMLAVIKDGADEGVIRNNMDSYLDEYNSRSGKPYLIKASLGVYHTKSDDSLDFEVLIKKSDVLMYADKQRKKNSAWQQA